MSKQTFLTIILSILSTFVYSQQIDQDLINASYNNNEKEVIELLRKGAKPDATTDEGVTSLMYAVQNGNLFIVQRLLEAGANPNIASFDIPAALENAVINNDTAISYILLKNNANPNIIDSANKMCPIFYAIENKNYVITDLLLYYGADPNTNIKSITPLEYAIYNQSDTSIINLLLKYGANPNFETSSGFTPLLYSIDQKNTDYAKLLLKNGAIATQKSLISDLDPLEYAIKKGSKEFVDLLLPYYSGNLNNYHSLALSQQFSYAASQIRKQTDKKYMMPVFGQFIFCANSLFTYNDLFAGAKIGLTESRYNFDFKVGISSRLFPKAILYEQSENNFLQLREKRAMYSVEINKYFTLKTRPDFSYGILLNGTTYFSYGSYNGIILPIQKKTVFAPAVGFWYKKGIGKFNLSYNYLSFDTNWPIYFSLDAMILIPMK